jgi:gamma-glutamyltranspeptidase / glutathione hydrolase
MMRTVGPAWRRAAVVTTSLVVALTLTLPAVAQLGGPGKAVVGDSGMVSTSNHYATLVGVEILQAGGNAVDAMVAVQLALTVTEPYASGIGGGCFIMLHDAASGDVLALDGREEAPKAYHGGVFLDDDGEVIPFDERSTGGMPVGVPGTLAAMARALDEHGTMEFAALAAPAIRLARDGFVLDRGFSAEIAANSARLAQFPHSASLYLSKDGDARAAGETFRNPDLADTLEFLSINGVDTFYTGAIAQDIVGAVRLAPVNPGVMMADDIARYRAVYREPVRSSYRGYEIVGMNMPTSGGASLAMMLNILEGVDLPSMAWGSLGAVSRIADAQNIVFADRNAYMGDADFVSVPLGELLRKDYARVRRALMRPFNAVLSPVAPGDFGMLPGVGSAEGGHTTHFSIVDDERNVVSVTTTIERYFGSAMTVPGRGFLLNNELTDFEARAISPQGTPVANAAAGGVRPRRTALGDDAATLGGKRPRSSMTPTIVLRDGQPVLAAGSPGGSTIIGTTLNVILNVLDFEMDPQEAVNAPRAIARNGAVDLESRLFANAALVAGLHAKGFIVRDAGSIGAAQVIRIADDGSLLGAADPRRDGLALGY